MFLLFALIASEFESYSDCCLLSCLLSHSFQKCQIGNGFNLHGKSLQQSRFRQCDRISVRGNSVGFHFIVEALQKAAPDIPVLSEESDGIDFETRSQWQRYFLVDPLDGTKEFVNRNGEFTVNIALIENHKPMLGAVYVPVQDRLY